MSGWKFDSGATSYATPPAWSGKEIVGLELGDDGRTLLDIEVYAPDGTHVAKLRKNAWSFGSREKFDFVRTADHVSMTEKATGRLILDATLSPSVISVAAADLYGPKGFHVTIGPDGTLQAGGVLMSGNTIDGFGRAIIIGSIGIVIGQR
ncbi:MAG TPA: hypothetical protein VGS01_05120 [Candidatus Limnocylindria bacterium]|nr:hypothetical protein [Candidatus Limnocylindria bacterium]